MCPVCGAAGTADRCARCGARTTGPVADALRAINAELHRGHARRDELVRQLTSVAAAAPAALADAAGATVAPGPTAQEPGADEAPVAASGGRAARWALRAPLSPQAVLAGAGVALLAAAAVVFTAVTWERLPQLAQLAVLASAAVAAGVGSRAAERRGLRATSGALVVLVAAIAGVIGWAGSDGRTDVALTLVLAASAAMLAGSSLAVTRGLVVLAAAATVAAWLGPFEPSGSWAQDAWRSAVATVSLGAGLLAWRGLRRTPGRDPSVGDPGVGEASVGDPSVNGASVGGASVGGASVGGASVGGASVGGAGADQSSVGEASGSRAAVAAEQSGRPGWPSWAVRDGAGVAAALVAAVAAPLAVLGAMAVAAAPEAPGLGIALVLPYLAAGSWRARRWPPLAGVVAFVAVLMAALTLVAATGMAATFAFALSSAPALLVAVSLPSRPLRLPVALGVGAVAGLRLDLVLEPFALAFERAAHEGLGAPAPAAPDAETAVALAAVLALVGCGVWLWRPSARAHDLGSLALLVATAAGVLWLPPVAAGGLLALSVAAGAAWGWTGWPALPSVVVASAALLALGSGLAGVAVWMVLAAAAAAAAARARHLELEFHAGLLVPGAAALLVARLATPEAPWPEIAALVVVVVALPLAVRWRRVAAEVAVWAVGVGAALLAATEGTLAAGNAAALLAVAAAAAATWGDRRVLWHVARAAALLAVWAWLDAAGVRVIEAYTVPAALVLGSVGVLALRRDDAVSSWRALGPALAVALTPTAALLVGDPDNLWRTLGLLAAAIALGWLGRTSRLGAPLAAGAVAALVVAAVHLWSVIGLAPRWVALTVGGGLLLWAAVTYEAQMRRAGQLRLRVAALR